MHDIDALHLHVSISLVSLLLPQLVKLIKSCLFIQSVDQSVADLRIGILQLTNLYCWLAFVNCWGRDQTFLLLLEVCLQEHGL